MTSLCQARRCTTAQDWPVLEWFFLDEEHRCPQLENADGTELSDLWKSRHDAFHEFELNRVLPVNRKAKIPSRLDAAQEDD
jgi:hypothetical protein